MTREDIFGKIQEALVDALGVDDDEVTMGATLVGDLEAESIDFLDIAFKIEQAFDFKIEQGELFPENVGQNPDFLVDGMVTPDGIVALKEKLPHVDFAEFEKDPEISKVADVFTVETIVNFVERKRAAIANA